jgi:nucleotide-binding universal stress UspA family protein
LAATDFSDVSLKAAAHGARLAQQAGAPFHLLHVIDSMDIPEDIISKIPEGSSLRNEINAEAESRLNAFLGSLGCDRSTIHVHLSWGTPWKEMKRLVEHLAVDLLVIGTVGRSGIKGLLLGNTAEKALSTCNCSILTVKPDGFVSPI